MNKALINLDRIHADFLRAEFKSEKEVKISTRNQIGTFIVALVKKSNRPKELTEEKSREQVTLIIPNTDQFNFDKYFLYFSQEDQKRIYFYLRSIMYAKAMIWVASAINSGRTAQYGILEFINRHKIRNNAQNLEHLKKLTYRAEQYRFQKTLESTEDAVNLHYKKII